MRSTMRPLRAAVLAALVAALPAYSRAGDGEVEVVDAPESATLTGARVAFGLPEVRELVRELAVGDDPGSARMPTGFASEICVLLEDEVGEAGGTVHSQDPFRISVAGSAAAATLVRARVAEIAAAIDAPVVVEVHVARLPADAPSDVGRDALRELVRAGRAEMVFGERATLRRGETLRRDAIERRTFVSGVAAEVAQEAAIAPTRTHEMTMGRRLAVHARALPSGRVALDVALHLARPDDTAGASGSSNGIDLPAVRFVSVAFPLLLAEGASGEARVPDPFGDGSVLVRVTLVKGPAPTEGPWRVLDLHVPAGGVAAQHAHATPGWLDAELGAEAVADEERDARTDACASRLLEAGSESVGIAPGVVAVKGGALGAFEEVFEPELRTGVVARAVQRIDAAKLAAAPWYDPLDGRVVGEIPAGAARTSAPIRLPVRGDGPSLCLVGTWRRLVADVTVELAQAAYAVVPDVRGHFEGEAVLASLPAARDGRPATADVRHATCTILSRVQRPALLRSQVYGREVNDDGTKLDALTAATSRARVPAGRAAVTTVRREGADAVLETWTLE